MIRGRLAHIDIAGTEAIFLSGFTQVKVNFLVPYRAVPYIPHRYCIVVLYTVWYKIKISSSTRERARYSGRGRRGARHSIALLVD